MPAPVPGVTLVKKQAVTRLLLEAGATINELNAVRKHLSILKGGLIMATAGAWISNLPPGYALSQTELLGVATPIWFMVVLTAAAAWWMRNAGLGRSIYAGFRGRF